MSINNKFEQLENYKLITKREIENYIQSNNFDEAESLLDKYEDVVKNDADALCLRGVILILKGDIKAALDNFQKGLYLDNKNFDILYNIAYAYENLDKLYTALEYYIKAFEAAKSEELQKEVYKKSEQLSNYIIEQLLSLKILSFSEG